MIKQIALGLVTLTVLSACSSLELGSHMAKQVSFPSDAERPTGYFKVGNPYRIKGRTYRPYEKYQYSETGMASWYGPGFHGKMTANGEIFNKYELTAAHRTLQMPSIVRVTNLENGRSIIVRVNDRGPFAHNRIIDLSEKAAEAIGMKTQGTARVRVDVMERESRKVATAAKRGLSTRGTELAFNRGQVAKGLEMPMTIPVIKPGSPPIRMATAPDTPKIRNERFQRVLSSQAAPIAKPANLNTYNPLFIQAGTFKNEDNAMTMKAALYNIKEPITIHRSLQNRQPIYKVRIGPVSSVEKANKILTLLNRQGRNARMVVAQH